jgi:hypothetical protein
VDKVRVPGKKPGGPFADDAVEEEGNKDQEPRTDPYNSILLDQFFIL